MRSPDVPAALCDIGLNLTHGSFQRDRDEVMARAHAAGVVQVVLTGTSVASSQASIDLAHQHPGVMYATTGIHPHEAARCDEHSLATLRTLAADPRVVAVGECGLDYNRNFSPKDAQRRVFAAQLALALQVEKPLFLHERDAHADLLDLLDAHGARDGALPVPAVVHCFTGGPVELSAYLSRGFYIGVTGWICDERRGQALREAIRHVPLDRLMIETDAPFLVPRTAKPAPPHGRNEPALLVYVARAIAEQTGQSFATIAAATTATARQFFRLPTPEPRS